MAEPEIKQFLNYLADYQKVVASTRNQALGAVLFLYRSHRFYRDLITDQGVLDIIQVCVVVNSEPVRWQIGGKSRCER